MSGGGAACTCADRSNPSLSCPTHGRAALRANDPDHHDVFPGGKAGVEVKPGPLTPEEAAALGSELETLSAEACEQFFDLHRNSTDRLRLTLARFARASFRAKKMRLAGRITAALAHEREATRIYNSLPEEARW